MPTKFKTFFLFMAISAVFISGISFFILQEKEFPSSNLKVAALTDTNHPKPKIKVTNTEVPGHENYYSLHREKKWLCWHYPTLTCEGGTLDNAIYRTGFKNINDVTDSRILCSNADGCSSIPEIRAFAANADQPVDRRYEGFRFFIPPNLQAGSRFQLYMPNRSKIAGVARFGSAPETTVEDFEGDYSQVPYGNPTGAKSLEELKNDFIIRNADGSFVMMDLYENATEGGWVYVKVLSFDGQEPLHDGYKYYMRVKPAEYTPWYEEAIKHPELWDEYGDPIAGKMEFDPEGEGIKIRGSQSIIEQTTTDQNNIPISDASFMVDAIPDLKAGDGQEAVLNAFIKLRDGAYINYHLIENLTGQKRNYFEDMPTPQQWMPIEEKGLMGGIKNDLANVIWSNHKFLDSTGSNASSFWEQIPTRSDLLNEEDALKRLEKGRFPYTAQDINRLRDAIKSNHEVLLQYSNQTEAPSVAEHSSDAQITESINQVMGPVTQVLSYMEFDTDEASEEDSNSLDKVSQAKFSLQLGLGVLSQVLQKTFNLETIFSAFREGEEIMDIIRGQLALTQATETLSNSNPAPKPSSANQKNDICKGKRPIKDTPFSGPTELLVYGPEGNGTWHYDPDENGNCWWHCTEYGTLNQDKTSCKHKPSNDSPQNTGPQCSGDAPFGLFVTPIRGEQGLGTWEYKENPKPDDICWWHCPENATKTTLNEKEGCMPGKKGSETLTPQNVSLSCTPAEYSIGDQISCSWSGANVENWTYVSKEFGIDSEVNGVSIYGNINSFSPKTEDGFRPGGSIAMEEMKVTNLARAKAFNNLKMTVIGSTGNSDKRQDATSNEVTLKSSTRACDLGEAGIYEHGTIVENPQINQFYTCWDGEVYTCEDKDCKGGAKYE